MVFCAIGGVGFFIFILYATIKTKSTSLNKYEPFKEWVGKTVTLDKETVVFKEKVSMQPNNRYPYILLDKLHPQWQYVEDRKNLPEPDLVEIHVFPAGTKFAIEKAVQYTNGVSGSSYPIVFGTIGDGEEAYKIGYQWGDRNLGRSFDRIEECWQFHQAPWQAEPDTTYYALPDAHWW